MKDTAYSFAQKVDQQLEATSSSDYHSRSGRIKQLREELYPISRLALLLKQPGLQVEVEAFENNDAADGRIWISGFREGEFDVQVTYDHSYEEALRSEMLFSEGHAFGAGEIKRDKKSKKIVATGVSVDHDEHFDRIAESIIKLFKKKVAIAYSSNTYLIITFDEVKLRGLANWKRLFNSIEQKDDLGTSDFLAIYLLNSATNEIQKIT